MNLHCRMGAPAAQHVGAQLIVFEKVCVRISAESIPNGATKIGKCSRRIIELLGHAPPSVGNDDGNIIAISPYRGTLDAK